MRNKILSTKELVENIYDGIKKEVGELNEKGIFPKLAVILVGDVPASISHTIQKQKACKRCGILSEQFNLDENISEEELLSLIERINNDSSVSGILVQLPLPGHINTCRVIINISPEKDVDGFHFSNIGKLFLKLNCLFSCTPYGIMKLLKFYNIELKGKVITIVGNSNIVGKPLALMMINKNATVINCNEFTDNLKKFTLCSDIVVSATGKANLITEDMIKEDAIVIDVGYCRVPDSSEKGYKIQGDVDFNSIIKKAKLVTPVPGGIGPLTVAVLMENVVAACKKQVGK